MKNILLTKQDIYSIATELVEYYGYNDKDSFSNDLRSYLRQMQDKLYSKCFNAKLILGSAQYGDSYIRTLDNAMLNVKDILQALEVKNETVDLLIDPLRFCCTYKSPCGESLMNDDAKLSLNAHLQGAWMNNLEQYIDASVDAIREEVEYAYDNNLLNPEFVS